jgi:glutaredoxin
MRIIIEFVYKYLKIKILIIYMEFISPDTKGFTVYSKSGCINCIKVKNLIKDKFFLITEIDCNEYILEDKEAFLSFIEELAKKSHKTFPMVFYEGKFIGGLSETIDQIDKLLLSFEEIF